MIEWVLEKLIAILPMIGDIGKDRRELADKALESVSRALTETCIYVKRYEEQGKRDLDMESNLVRFWSEAAIPLRHIDKELSDICEYKSEYWLDPKTWNPKQANGTSISLENVREKYRKKLH